MISKVLVVVVLSAWCVLGGEVAPPAKAQSYSVPSVAKVSYPAPTLTKSVETYSAPSIEKTTTITRTITAPLNAPALKSVHYSAPSPPIHAPQQPILFAAPGFGNQGYGVQELAGLAIGGGGGYYAQQAYPELTFAQNGLGYAPQGLNLATTYAAPSLGYNLANGHGHHGGHAHYAPAPVVTKGYGH